MYLYSGWSLRNIHFSNGIGSSVFILRYICSFLYHNQDLIIWVTRVGLLAENRTAYTSSRPGGFVLLILLVFCVCLRPACCVQCYPCFWLVNYWLSLRFSVAFSLKIFCEKHRGFEFTQIANKWHMRGTDIRGWIPNFQRKIS